MLIHADVCKIVQCQWLFMRNHEFPLGKKMLPLDGKMEDD